LPIEPDVSSSGDKGDVYVNDDKSIWKEKFDLIVNSVEEKFN